jgi:hypothetical protein
MMMTRLPILTDCGRQSAGKSKYVLLEISACGYHSCGRYPLGSGEMLLVVFGLLIVRLHGLVVEFNQCGQFTLAHILCH